MLAEIQRIWLSHLALRKLALKQCYIERITLWTAFSSCLLIACVSSHNYSWEVWDGISDYCDHLALCCRDARSLLPTLGPDTCDIPNLLSISHIGNPCCGETLKCCFARNWVLSKSGHTFCSPLGSCVKQTNKQTNRFQPVSFKHREMLSRLSETPSTFAEAKAVYTPYLKQSQLAACLNFPQYCSLPRLWDVTSALREQLWSLHFSPEHNQSSPVCVPSIQYVVCLERKTEAAVSETYLKELVSILCFLEDIFSAHRSSMPGLSSLPELSQQHRCSIVSCFTWSFTVWDLNICSSKKRLCQPPEKWSQLSWAPVHRITILHKYSQKASATLHGWSPAGDCVLKHCPQCWG